MSKALRTLATPLSIFAALILTGCNEKPSLQSPSAAVSWDPFLDTLQVRTLKFFLETTDPNTGLTPDRWPTPAPSSIAAVGFALTTYPIAVERELITRREAAQRTLNTLRFFWRLSQNPRRHARMEMRAFFD
jgi:hypothetical protein